MSKKTIRVTRKGIRENNIPNNLANSAEFLIDPEVQTDLDASRIKNIPVSNLSGANNSTVLTYNSNSNLISLQSISGSSLRVPNEITVSNTDQSDFRSIKSAVDSITGSSVSNPFSVLVFPGLYYEQSFTIPSYVTVYSPSGQTIVSASNNNVDFLFLSQSSRLNNIKTSGPLNASSIVAIDSVDEIYIDNITVENSNIGLKVNSGSNTLVRNVDFRNCSTGTYNEGNLIFDNISFVNCITGTINSGNGIINSTSVFYRQLDGEELLALLTDGESTFNCASAIILNHHSGIISSGSSVINAKSISINNTSGLDIEQRTTGSRIRISSGQINSSKISISNESLFEVSFNDLLFGDEGIKSFGQLSVGFPEAGKESNLGRGDSYTRGMVVYQSSSAGGFVNVTDQASSLTGSNFTFPSNELSSSLYFSSNLIDLDNGSDFLTFPGIEIIADSTGTVGSGSVELQFWNGSDWQRSPFSVTENAINYLPRGNKILIDDTNQQLRFCQRFIKTLWQKNDPINSGTTRYWSRLIMSGSAYGTLPQIQQVKLHTDSFKSEIDGFITYFGSARPQKTASWNITDAIPASASPSNQDLYLSKKLDAGREENKFAKNSTNRITAAVRSPLDLDSGCVITFEITFVGGSSNSGNVVWNLYWDYQSPGSNIYLNSSSAPESSPGQKTKQFITSFDSSQNNILKFEVQTMDFSGMIPYRQEPQIGDVMWISLERDGSSVSDDYDGDISVLTANVKYLSWCNGAHPSY